MTKKTTTFLAISFGWTWLIGLFIYLNNVSFSSPQGMALLALLYMPTPLVAALIAEKGVVKERLRFPAIRSKQMAVFLFAPIAAVVGFAGLYFLSVYLLGNVLQVPAFGHLATTSGEIAANAAGLMGQDAVDAAGTPPAPLVMIIATLWGAVIAGWTINALFAMGEEYGWRGLLWDEFKPQGFARANVIVGSIWGLWHAPLILQGYNYPGQPLLGLLLMMVFAIGFSFILSHLRERTGSVWPAAAAHGIFNALAVMLLLFLVDANTAIAGPLGILGAVVLASIGLGVRGRQSGMSLNG